MTSCTVHNRVNDAGFVRGGKACKAMLNIKFKLLSDDSLFVMLFFGTEYSFLLSLNQKYNI